MKEKILLLPPIAIKNKMYINWNTKISGIYAWVNEINGKMYIGRSVNLYKRVYGEINGFRNNKEQNMKKLFRAIRKHGIENFRVVRLLECPSKNLNQLEKLLIEYYDTKRRGYNCTFGGDGTHGHKVKPEQIERQRAALKKYWSDETRKTHSEKMKKWANETSRRNHLIDVGTKWTSDPLLVKKQLLQYKKSLTPERIEQQRKTLIRRYSLNRGNSMRYKEIVLTSPKNEIIKISNVKQFCIENNLGRNGFYKFLRRDDQTNSFRGWKVISKTA